MQRAAHLLGEARVGRARERHAHPRVQAVCVLLQSDEAARVQRDGVAPTPHAAHALAAPVQIAEYLCEHTVAQASASWRFGGFTQRQRACPRRQRVPRSTSASPSSGLGQHTAGPHNRCDAVGRLYKA